MFKPPKSTERRVLQADLALATAISHRVIGLPASTTDYLAVKLSRYLTEPTDVSTYRQASNIQLDPDLNRRISSLRINIVGLPVVQALVFIEMAPGDTVFDQTKYPD